MIFDTNATPDRYISNDRESILYYEILEEQRFRVEINLLKKIFSFLGIRKWFLKYFLFIFLSVS